MEDIIKANYDNLSKLDKKLQLLNPTISLEKGHGILLNKNGFIIKSVEDLIIEDTLKILMKDGSIKAIVKEIEREGGVRSMEIKNLSYEEALKELEIILDKLENNNHTLDESLEMFKKRHSII